MGISNIKISLWFMLIGQWLKPTVNGVVRVCPRKQSGKRRPGVQMVKHFPGEMSLSVTQAIFLISVEVGMTFISRNTLKLGIGLLDLSVIHILARLQ